ncbi:hypothetical protein EK904_014697 [Melospiza melodia maxima]|nr:hypothetical protein EK904_014697 [Melospiza melodia maxima]
MTTLRAFTCDDLFRFNNINHAKENCQETGWGREMVFAGTQELKVFDILKQKAVHYSKGAAALMLCVFTVMGKAEGSVAREEWHGHVTALSVAPEFRRLGLAAKLMELLEEISEKKGGFFVDLFVRVSNQVAVNMYKQLGYSVYRTVLEYYSASSGEPDEDAYDMRKALSRDTEKKSVIPLPHPVRPEDIE